MAVTRSSAAWQATSNCLSRAGQSLAQGVLDGREVVCVPGVEDSPQALGLGVEGPGAPAAYEGGPNLGEGEPGPLRRAQSQGEDYSGVCPGQAVFLALGSVQGGRVVLAQHGAGLVGDLPTAPI
ncbi:hypothetical protein ADL02_31300 [Streptomyces sp. NRRL WC-3723]|nr:hypothetical protein ADL02_31300 [Streptomyces sp. NRRL WC-3723]